MEPSFEEAFDFDLNFIQQPVQNVMSNNKLRKAILIAKKKTIATDSLIKKYLAKKEVVRQSELMLNSAKEECKRVCIDYKDTLEKCTSLEKELQTLDHKCKTLEANYMLSQNECEAIKSHANQLQSLIKENELKIESLQLQNKLLDKKKEKESKGSQGRDSLLIKENEFKKEIKKNHDKGYSLLKKENGIFLNHILLFKDIIMGKKKLQKEHRLILNKYKKPNDESEICNDDNDHDDNYSSDETDFFDDVTPPLSNETLLSPYQNHNKKIAPLKVFKENIDDQCISNVLNGIHESELDSEDTGRGSSLAFSDSGKYFNSPDYSYDTPHIEIVQQSKINTEKYLDASTNTSWNKEHKATSPLMFDDVALLSDNMDMQENRQLRPTICSDEYIVTDSPLITGVVSNKNLMFDDVALLSDNIDMQENKHLRSEICRPEFLTDIPLSTEIVTKIKMVDCASSPIPELDMINASLNPSKSNCEITVEDLMLDVSLSLNNEAVTTVNDKREMLDCATSPIPGIDRVHASLSPIVFDDIPILKVNDKIGNENCSYLGAHLNTPSKDFMLLEKNGDFTTVANVDLPQISSANLSKNSVVEKNCLEENNGYNLSSKSDDDKEIEMIFSSMRLEHRLLTPIPHTPLKLKKSINRKQALVIKENCTDHKCCKNIIGLEKKYLILQKNYAAMEEVIKNMKSSLQAINILPLKSINDRWMNEGSIDVFSDSETDKGEERLDRHTESNKLDSMKPSNKNIIDMTPSHHTIEEVMEVNDDENVPLSKLVCENVTKPKACRSVTYEDNESTEEPEKIVTSDESASCNIKISNVRNESPVRNSNIGRDDLNNTNSTQDEDYHNKTKSNKHKKLSKLEKLRHKMLPKYKISRNANISLRKKKSIVATVKRSDTEHLKNKLAYEKAVRIMAETKIKNNSVKNIEKIKHFSCENVQEKYTSKLNLSNIEASMDENVSLCKLRTVQPSPNSEDISLRSNMQTTRSQSKSNSDKTNKKESIGSVNKAKTVEDSENNINKSISNSNVILMANESNIVKQKTEHTELESEKLCISLKNNRRTTRSQSKLSESEGDSSLSHKHQQNIICDPTSTGTTGQTINNEENLKEKSNSQSKEYNVTLSSANETENSYQDKINDTSNKTDDTCNFKHRSPGSRKRSRALCDEDCEPIPKRVLRSSKAKELIIENINTSSGVNNSIIGSNVDSDETNENKCDTSIEVKTPQNKNQEVVDYGDLNMFATTKNNSVENSNDKSIFTYPKNSILCKSIDRYGKKSIRFRTNKVIELASNSICTKLEEDIANITQMPADKINQGMNKLVEDVQKMPIKSFLNGLIKYLKQPMRKEEMFKLVNTPPAPPMTKSEQILLFVIKHLKQNHALIVDSVLETMEFSLFQLNKTPEFDIVESMSHFYAILCRYFGLKHRLRLFLLDAMYCMSFKAVTVVKNCLDVWMHVLPLAHMGIAKSPLVTCLVYLLHFYKCEDKFKKIDAIRNTLQHKYLYKITEMTEAKMLEMFMTAVKEINDVPSEKKILRISLIVLAKRRGAMWCQKNIIKNMLLPIIEKEKCSDVSKQFAVSMLGPLVKPYPMDMKVHSEIIVNQLMDMLDQNPSDSMKEAIFTSLIFMSRQNHFRVTQALLNWEPESVSPEFEGVIKDFVTEKPIKTWTAILPKMLYQQR